MVGLAVSHADRRVIAVEVVGSVDAGPSSRIKARFQEVPGRLKDRKVPELQEQVA